MGGGLMAGAFLYFLDLQKSQVTVETIRKRLGGQLADCVVNQAAFDTRLSINDVHGRGPAGSSGVVITPLPAHGESLTSKNLGYYPDHQKWEQIGDWWLGTNLEHPPTPTSLQRPEIVSGYEYELGDGNIWTCPVIRQPGGEDGTPNVPTSWGVDADGQFGSNVLPSYQWAWEMAGEMWDIFIGGERAETNTPEQSFGYCCKALSLNYRVGPHELSRLGVLTSANYPSVFKAAIDGELVEAFVKKNQSDNGEDSTTVESVSTEPGSEDITQTTNLQEADSHLQPQA